MLFQALQAWFAEPTWPEAQVEMHRTYNHQHGCHKHRTLEHQVHHVRDVTGKEDACQFAIGPVAHDLAALRNELINGFRLQSRTSIASALHHFGSFASRVLRLVSFEL